MNEKLLPGVKIPQTIALTTDIACAKDAELVILALPSFAIAQTAEQVARVVQPNVPIVNVGKGLDAAHGYCRFSETIGFRIRACGSCADGLTRAEEVARGIPTAIVAASESREAAELCQDVFMNEVFRVYTSSDVIGAELGGTLRISLRWQPVFQMVWDWATILRRGS